MPIAKEARAISEGWFLATIPHITGGVNRALADHLVGDEEAVDLLNLTPNERMLLALDTGYVIKETGACGGTWASINALYSAWSEMTGLTWVEIMSRVRGTPQRIFEYVQVGGTTSYLLVTTATVYLWVAAPAQWQYVSNGTSTTLAAEASGHTIEVADSTGFVAGEYIGVALDGGVQHLTQVDSIPDGTHIKMVSVIPEGGAAASSNVVLEAVALGGSTDFYPDGDHWPSADAFVFTNGVDQPQTYDGSTCEAVTNLPSAPNFTARTVQAFDNYLLFGWTTEGGTERPYRIRRCDTADYTEWATGNAGFDDLLDSQHGVLKLQKLGNVCAAYREGSISIGTAVNTSDKVLEWPTRVRGEGVLGTGCVVDLKDEHVVFGTNLVYRYKGGFDVESVSDSVRDLMFSAQGEIDPSNAGRCFAVHAQEHGEAWFVYTKTGASHPTRFLRINLAAGSWFVRDLTHPIVGTGTSRGDASKTWDGLTGDWLSQTWTWGSKQVTASAPTILLCGAEVPHTYEYDFVAGSDDGTALPYYVITKDFISLHKKLRVDFLECYIKGESIELSHSIDGGVTWTAISTESPGPSLTTVRATFEQVVSERIRFRWAGTGQGFGLGWFGFAYREESEV